MSQTAFFVGCKRVTVLSVSLSLLVLASCSSPGSSTEVTDAPVDLNDTASETWTDTTSFGDLTTEIPSAGDLMLDVESVDLIDAHEVCDVCETDVPVQPNCMGICEGFECGKVDGCECGDCPEGRQCNSGNGCEAICGECPPCTACLGQVKVCQPVCSVVEFGEAGFERAKVVRRVGDGFAVAGTSAPTLYGQTDLGYWRQSEAMGEHSMLMGEELDDQALHMAAYADGSVLVAGMKTTKTYGPSNLGSLWLVSIDKFGNVSWEDTYGELQGYNDRHFAFAQLEPGVSCSPEGDASVVLSAQLLLEGESSIWTGCVGTAGQVFWESSFPSWELGDGDHFNTPGALLPVVADGKVASFLLLTHVDSAEAQGAMTDVAISQLDSEGELCSHTIVSTLPWERVHSAVLTDDGNIVVAGERVYWEYDPECLDDWENEDCPLYTVFGNVYWVSALTPDGDTLWDDTLMEQYDSAALDVLKTDDGQFIVGGRVPGSGDGTAALLRSYSTNGDLLWSKEYPFPKSEIASVEHGFGEGFLVAGSRQGEGLNDQVFVMQVGKEGQLTPE